MIRKLTRKHPQGTPFTDIILVLCTQCGNQEMEMHYSKSRAVSDTNDQPAYQVADTCWNCFFKD